MHKNPVWLGFLILIAAVTAYFLGGAIQAGTYYQSLSNKASATVTEWTIVPSAEGYYVPHATYTFTHEGKTYSGEHTLENRTSLNEAAANEMLLRLKDREWTTWYNPTQPTDSVIDKRFPLSAFVSGILMLGIFGYFLWLGVWITRKTEEQ